MKSGIILILLFIKINAFTIAQSPLDQTTWNVVLDHPDLHKVKEKIRVAYMNHDKSEFHLNVYLPPDIKKSEKRPAVMFLSLFKDFSKWKYYESWARLIAAHGFIGITIETDEALYQECLTQAFEYLKNKGESTHIDANRIGVFAQSHNVEMALPYLHSDNVFTGIKCAVLYYGLLLHKIDSLRKDLPVFFVAPETLVDNEDYLLLSNQAQKNKAPWTLKLATGMPMSFDNTVDTEEARKIIRETIYFWKNQLETGPAPRWPYSMPKEYMAFRSMGDLKKAEEVVITWLRTHSDDVDAWRIYFTILKNSGRFTEAETIYKQHLNNRYRDAEFIVDLTAVLLGLNKVPEAEKLLSEASKSGILEWYHYRGVGRALDRMKRHTESSKYYEKAVELKPEGENFYNLACSYALANEKDKAFANLNKAVEHQFNSKQRFENSASLESLKSESRWKTLLEKLK